MDDTRLICPTHGVKLEKGEITQGDTLLGFMYICPKDENCDYCLDADDDGNPIFEEAENGR